MTQDIFQFIQDPRISDLVNVYTLWNHLPHLEWIGGERLSVNKGLDPQTEPNGMIGIVQ